MLRQVNGRFILSLNDHKDVRDLFAGFKMKSVTTKYTVGSAAVSNGARDLPRKELLISNFTIAH